MKKKLIYFLILIFVGGGLYIGIRSFKHAKPHHTENHQKALYFCPMHPHITSEKPGYCPIYNMALQKADEDEAAEKEPLFYRHPMNPKVTSPVPSKDEMGMDYIPVYEEDITGEDTSTVSERTSFKLSKKRQKLIGVTSTKVVEKELSYDVRASGKVAFDPDLFTAIEEYRQALISQKQTQDSAFEDLKEDATQMVKSSQTKLELMGLTLDQIQILADHKTDAMSLLLPKGKVWIYAEVFEYEIAGVQQGQKFHVEVPSLPGKTFMGVVSSISPVLNASSRTFRVRGEVEAPENLLRPDTFVNVKIKVEFGRRVVVPRDAVLHSGDESFVFVIQDQTSFEPRRVKVGVKFKDDIEIVSGVQVGEIVVTGANFLIDSESRLKNALKSLGGE